ncbi:hypothetical protein [Sphingosinicella rhizophila]|nr:hypothetical protein [Sphingosinicella sp. GR2756]
MAHPFFARFMSETADIRNAAVPSQRCAKKVLSGGLSGHAMR